MTGRMTMRSTAEKEHFQSHCATNIYIALSLIIRKSPKMSRYFSSTARRLIKLVGRVTLTDVEAINGTNGPQWATNVEQVAGKIESEVGVRLI